MLSSTLLNLSWVPFTQIQGSRALQYWYTIRIISMVCGVLFTGSLFCSFKISTLQRIKVVGSYMQGSYVNFIQNRLLGIVCVSVGFFQTKVDIFQHT